MYIYLGMMRNFEKYPQKVIDTLGKDCLSRRSQDIFNNQINIKT